jgi:ZIP family zinc transporter
VGAGLAIRIGGNERAIASGIGFFAGMMLLVSFLWLMPETTREAGLNAAGAVAHETLIRDTQAA